MIKGVPYFWKLIEFSIIFWDYLLLW